MKNKKSLPQWQKMVVWTACICMLLTGCRNSADTNKSGGGAMNFMAAQEKGETDGIDSESYSEAEKDMAPSEDGETTENMDTSSSETSSSAQSGQDVHAVRKEMLVYRGMLMIDTLTFHQSVASFKKLIEDAGGFIETETFSDDFDMYDGYYAVEESDKHNLFTATVRIPSSKYNSVMDSAGNIGDLRSRESNAENVTQAYSTYQSKLQVYETEHKRYLHLLKNAKEEKYALQLEEKIFDLQVKIADLKSKITNLETDVAYSYIDITIREVIQYQREIEETDTFLQRLKETCSDSWENFLGVLEGILFILIHIWYYIIIALVVIYCILRYKKHRPKKKASTDGPTARTRLIPADDPASLDTPDSPDGSAPSDEPADETEDSVC